MRFCLFLTFRHDDAQARLPQPELDALRAALSATPGLAEALLHQPASAHDPYLHDGAPPLLALQLYFAELPLLEAAAGPDGALHALADAAAFPTLAACTATQQAMLGRRYSVPDPNFANPPGTPFCTYLVAYEGEAEDLPAWLAYYIAHHPPIMARFPGIRAIEIDTRVDWCGTLPWSRQDCMQRNKVVFDSPEALTAALNSPVRHEMREDFQRFPPFTGRNTHYPMLTEAMASATR